MVALLDRHRAQVVERKRDALAVIERSGKRKAFLEQCARRGIVGLVKSEAARDIEHPRVLQGGLSRCAFGKDTRTPLSPFGNISPRKPEAMHRPAKPDILLRSRLAVAPLERRAQIAVLLFETSQPVGLLRTEQFPVRLLDQCKEVVSMTLPNRLGASAFYEALPGILPDGLEQSVAKARVALLDSDQALIDERGQEIEHLAIFDLVAGADPLRRLERPPTGKYRKPPHQELLVVLQEVVTPVDHRAQRLLARERRARSSSQEAEAMIQPAIDLFDGERSHPRRRQLDRQRDPIEPMADGNERRGVLVGDTKVPADPDGAIDEKLQGLEWGDRGRRVRIIGFGQR